MKKFSASLILILVAALPATAAVSKIKKTPKIWYTHDEKNNFEMVIWRETAKGKPEKLNVKAYPVEDAECDWVQIDSDVFICTDDKDTAPVCIKLEKGEKCLDIQRGPWRVEFWDEEEDGKIDPSWPEYTYSMCIKGETYENIIFIDVDDKDNKIKILAKISGLMNNWTDFENTYDLRIIDECRYLFTYSVPDTKRGKNRTADNKNLWHGAAILEMHRNKNGGLDVKVTPLCKPTDTVDYRAEYFDQETNKCVIEKRTVKSSADWDKNKFAKTELNIDIPAGK